MNRILWMADEIIAQTHPAHWEDISRLSRELFDTIGVPNITHEVIMPQSCIGKLGSEILARKFSVAIDLTGGWLSSSLRGIIPNTPSITEFHVSRVRDVSDPSLGTTGHIISTAPNRINELKDTFDFRHPLILDDVSFSGLSSVVAMEKFNLDPKETTHGFLILNEGDLGPNPGARSRLESVGSRIFGGHPMNTSENEDGWHIKDFIGHKKLERILGASLMVQELFEQDGKDSHVVRRLFANEALRQLFFPNAKTLRELKQLELNTQFLFNHEHQPIHDSIHMTNPTLLISPYVLQHISSKQFREHFDQVAESMISMRQISFGQEARFEAIAGLRDVLAKDIEGNFFHPERIL